VGYRRAFLIGTGVLVGLLAPTCAGSTPLQEAPQAPPARSLRSSVETAVQRRLPEFLRDESSRRFTFGRGTLGLGGYGAFGYPDTGVDAPPLRLYPLAGAGNSLAVSPFTGRRY
jgi:hypothetical protein